MPADSEHQPPREPFSDGPGVTPVPLPHTWRPLGPRVVGIVLGGGLLVMCAVAWFGFDDQTRASFTLFQRLTLLGVGVLAFGCLYALLRSRAVATRDSLVVVNGYRRREYAWAEIVAVRLPPGAPWVTLDLADGENVSVMGIQGSDGERARRAARDLRLLVRAAAAQAD